MHRWFNQLAEAFAESEHFPEAEFAGAKAFAEAAPPVAGARAALLHLVHYYYHSGATRCDINTCISNAVRLLLHYCGAYSITLAAGAARHGG